VDCGVTRRNASFCRTRRSLNRKASAVLLLAVSRPHDGQGWWWPLRAASFLSSSSYKRSFGRSKQGGASILGPLGAFRIRGKRVSSGDRGDRPTSTDGISGRPCRVEARVRSRRILQRSPVSDKPSSLSITVSISLVRCGSPECAGTRSCSALIRYVVQGDARRRSRVAQAEVCKTFHAGSIPAAASHTGRKPDAFHHEFLTLTSRRPNTQRRQ
jgi:hypothetical protein